MDAIYFGTSCWFGGCSGSGPWVQADLEWGLYPGGRQAWNPHQKAFANHPRVIDVRNIGLVAGIELEPRPDAPGARAFETFVECFQQGVLIRVTGDTIALSPPLIAERAHIDRMFEVITRVLKRLV